MNIKSPENRKSTIVSFRINPEEKKKLEMIIKHIKQNKSIFLRDSLNDIIRTPTHLNNETIARK